MSSAEIIPRVLSVIQDEEISIGKTLEWLMWGNNSEFRFLKNIFGLQIFLPTQMTATLLT